MADIRQNTNYLDDFQRPDENPLVGPTGTEWKPVAPSSPTVWGPMELESQHATHEDSATFGFYYWEPLALDGDDAECWAFATGGNANGTAWRVCLLKDVSGASGAVDGYYFGFDVTSSGGSTKLRKFTNGSGTDIDTNTDSPQTGNPGPLMIRRNGNDVEGWAVTTPGDLTSWTLYVSAADTSYTTGLYPAIGVVDNSSNQLCSFSGFGAGPLEPTRQQFFRLLHN